VETAAGNSVKAVLTWNAQLAYETILRDQVVNRTVKNIDDLCHAFVARHSPTAGHLRFVSSVLRVNIALERIGDYAVTICREMARLSKRPDQRLTSDLEISVEPTTQALRQALEAFQTGNSELARGTKEMASHLGKTFDKAFSDLVDEGETRAAPILDLFALLVMFNRLSRICDQAKNICEETVFASVGETKPAKRFRILFVDDGNSCMSHMAVAVALRCFPDCAEYFAAGSNPAEDLRADFTTFMETRGHDLQEGVPARLEATLESLSEYHIIVTLSEDLIQDLGQIPYHVVVLDWSSCSEHSKVLESLYNELTQRISELLEILTGEMPS
jgi:phosphate transport system protein